MPVMPGYIHADTPHERTVQQPGTLCSCNSIVTGDTRPRGMQTRYIAHPWSANAGRLVVSDWRPIVCGHDGRARDPACAGCANNQPQPPA